MKVIPKVRGFICTTAHPVGCFENVSRQAAYAKEHAHIEGVKNALIIGASTGYGLASRITLAFGGGVNTVGVAFEREPSDSRTATAGWYNTLSFEKLASEAGLYAKSFNGDAYSADMKRRVVDCIKADLGQVDCVVYSLAAPRRTLSDGSTVSSVIKPIGEAFTEKTIDLRTGEVHPVTVSPATEQEVADTVRVMGGEDWEEWIAALAEAGVLAEHAVTLAYSYIGPELTHPVYLNGTIGRAKADLQRAADAMNGKYGGLRANIALNKALVTQSSAAIPVVPLYISLLYRVMKEQGIHEGCIEQMVRLFTDRVYGDHVTDEQNRYRADDWELLPAVQTAVTALWNRVQTDNIKELADVDGYWSDFYQMFGFEVPGVDYQKEVDILHI